MTINELFDKGRFSKREAMESGISKYQWDNLLYGDLIKNVDGMYESVIYLSEDNYKTIVANINYKRKNKDRDKKIGIDKDLLSEFLKDLENNIESNFSLVNMLKNYDIPNKSILIKTLKELEIVSLKQKVGAELIVDKIDFDLVYNTYKKNVKEHCKKYKKTKRTYTSIYE